jgi:CubicO group peptidase (beta-lactamase class C family)
VRILSPRTVALMTTNQVGTLHSQTGLGFGWASRPPTTFGANGLDSQGAFGWSGAYSTMYASIPRRGWCWCS